MLQYLHKGQTGTSKDSVVLSLYQLAIVEDAGFASSQLQQQASNYITTTSAVHQKSNYLFRIEISLDNIWNHRFSSHISTRSFHNNLPTKNFTFALMLPPINGELLHHNPTQLGSSTILSFVLSLLLSQILDCWTVQSSFKRHF